MICETNSTYKLQYIPKTLIKYLNKNTPKKVYIKKGIHPYHIDTMQSSSRLLF